jgi:hypothetical protein
MVPRDRKAYSYRPRDHARNAELAKQLAAAHHRSRLPWPQKGTIHAAGHFPSHRGRYPQTDGDVQMIRNLALATAGFAMIAGFAVAQDVQTTTETHAQSSTTPVKKGQEAYQWSVDTTTTKVPVHPTVVEKSTTVVNEPAPPPPVVHEHTNTTTTTTKADGDE